MSLSFIRGLVAAVNPCGFILLPTYLMYFLGISSSAVGTQRATIRRALLVSGAVSAGFLSVFLVAGFISYNFTSFINENAKYATGFIGVALIGLGVAMLFGYKPSFMNPNLNVGEKDKTIRSMFIYGIAYAVASIGCTIGLFIATVFSTTSNQGIVTGVGNVVAYGAGMALLVSALTIALAFANTGLLKFLRRSLAYVDRIAAAFVVLSGFYLLWYFYWVDLENPWSVTAFGNRTLEATLGDRTRARSVTEPITEWVEMLQADASSFLNDNWGIVAIVFLSIVSGALVYVNSKKWMHVAIAAAVGVIVSIFEPAVLIVTVAALVGGYFGVRASQRADAAALGEVDATAMAAAQAATPGDVKAQAASGEAEVDDVVESVANESSSTIT
ncbi:MAG: cytochrome c-type biogenesis protein [Candidatus Aldehydirespiratoraceae bacterium]|jgi:cytochrome c-type biogenesis protein